MTVAPDSGVVNLIGFDSAWADNPRVPGAISALRLTPDRGPGFDPPRLVGFSDALRFIHERHTQGDLTIVAIDQPTIVPNQTGARPVDRAVASLVSYSGGGVQPAYRDKAALFGDGAPIWRFLHALDFSHDAEAAVGATAGGFVVEVYPALAVLSLDPAFVAEPRCGPRYNPSRPTFKLAAWDAVCRAVACEAHRLGLAPVGDWCVAVPRDAQPKKRQQDMLDAVICLLIAARWRADRASCVRLGDACHGFIVAPVAADVRVRLERAARAVPVPYT